MSLSKQLYIIIAFLFFMIFTGNFIISIKNTKEYLEIESTTKAKDTATSLGLSLKPLMGDINDPEIKSIINAISNSGFYKEIRLENADFIVSEKELINASTELDDSLWEITDLSVDEKFGKIERVTSDEDLSNKLASLENEENVDFINKTTDFSYRFIPSEAYKDGGNITFNFTAKSGNKKINTFANITLEKVIYKDIRPVKFEYVPKWFINLIPINVQEMSKKISDGWTTQAIIYVSSNPGDAYDKLYEQAKNTIMYSIVAFLISMVFLFIFVRYLLKPLKQIEAVAQNISKGEFKTIKDLPWTTEIKNVSIAINGMSKKIENMITKLTSNLEVLSKQLSEDTLTSLSLKETFDTDIKKMFLNKQTGFIFNIKLSNLADFAKAHSNKEVNKYIQRFADILKNITKNEDIKTSAYRVFGSEFLLVANNITQEESETLCKKLQKEFATLAQEYELQEIAHIGAVPIDLLSTNEQLVKASHEAYEKAKQIGPNEFFVNKNTEVARSMEDWRELISQIIDDKKFDVNLINDAFELNGKSSLIMQEAFTSAKDKDDENIPIGTFVSIAENCGKIIEFDKAVISKVINLINANNITHEISINLSLDSIKDESFMSWLKTQFEDNKTLASKIVFSLTAYSVAKDFDLFKRFCKITHEFNCKVIIKRFESKFIEMNSIKDFNLDYIRLARNYTNDISLDKSKKDFVESINELSELLNIKVFAENVQSDEDYETIKELGIYGASR